MSLRLKILFMLFATLSVYGIIDYALHRIYVEPTFLEQENIQVEDHIAHTLETINFETRGLDILCHDWASWDDCYQFIQSSGTDTDFIQSNLGQKTLENNKLQVIYFLDRQGKVLWKGSNSDDPYALPDSEWSTMNPLLTDPQIKNGFHMTDQGPLLLVCRAVTTSSEEEPSNGFLIMGRLIHGTTLNSLINHLHGHIEFIPLTPTEILSADDLQTLLHKGSHLIKPTGTNLNIFKLINDIHSRPAFILHLITDRSAALHGLEMISYNALSNIFSGFITIGMFIFFIRSSIIKPINRLTSHVNNINTTQDLSTFPLETPKEDEIGILWKGFNQMVLRLQGDCLRRQSAEQQLRSSEKRIHAILDTAPDGIITVDKNGMIESLNSAAARMFDYSIEELEGESISKLVQKGHAQQLLSVLKNYPVTGYYKCFGSGCELEGRLYDGKLLPVHMRASSLQIGDETLFVWIIRDISELKAMNKKMEQSKRLVAIGEMGASIAHEIRNPLAGISAATQMLLKGEKTNSRQINILNEISVLIFRIENTVNQMLDYSRSWTPHKSYVEPMKIVRQVCSEATVNPPFDTITFEFSGSETAVIPLDKELIRQVLWNLYKNSAEAMTNGGTIHTNICVNERILLLTIEDEGCGMSAEVTEKLFTPFFTTKIYGTGLGLAICQRIIEAHQGNIQIDSSTDGGTKITLRFPTCPEAEEAEAEPRQPCGCENR